MSKLIVFVSGATGVLGQPVVRQLLAAGHRVRALAHSDASVQTLLGLGVEPVRADLFDPMSLKAAVAGADAILHLATRIPSASRSASPDAWRENDRIRREGTRNLIDAAIECGVGTVVYPSFAFVYPDSGEAWIDATTRQPAQPPHPFIASTLDAELEIARFNAAGGRGITLRMGGFYGPSSQHTHEMAALARRGFSPLPGPVAGFVPAIWVDDAASAVVAALSSMVSAGTYDVVDDEPLHRGEVSQAIAMAVGRRSLARIPSWVAALLSPASARLFSLSLRVSNTRFKQASGWSPSVPNARIGWQALGLGSAMPAQPAMRSGVSVGTIVGTLVLLLPALIGGLWITLSPASFFTEFPGFGRAWVSVDGPYNEHLLRDFGALNLSVAVVLLLALVLRERRILSVAMLSVLVSALPHFIYHAVHLDLLPTDLDRVLQTVTLGLLPALSVCVLAGMWMPDVRAWVSRRSARSPRSPEFNRTSPGHTEPANS